MIATSLKPLPLERLYIIKIWENLSMTEVKHNRADLKFDVS